MRLHNAKGSSLQHTSERRNLIGKVKFRDIISYK